MAISDYHSYDLNGIRTQKYIEGVAHSYITQNGKVVRETIGTGATAKVLDFIYDASGRPFALKYTDGTADPATYYYVLNLQGDVVGLTDSSGTHLVKYSYNAWGEPIAITDADDVAITDTTNIAHINPLRYRGYYYDTETGFYYLQSRYYDPVMHRFINADSLASTGQGVLGHNMFAYCLNNPTACADYEGKDATFVIAEEEYKDFHTFLEITIKVVIKTRIRNAVEPDLEFEQPDKYSATIKIGKQSVSINYNNFAKKDYSAGVELAKDVSFIVSEDGIGVAFEVDYGVTIAEVQISAKQRGGYYMPIYSGGGGGMTFVGGGFGTGGGGGGGACFSFSSSGGCYISSCGLGGGGLFGNSFNCFV